jgi:hypothetical protein
MSLMSAAVGIFTESERAIIDFPFLLVGLLFILLE